MCFIFFSSVQNTFCVFNTYFHTRFTAISPRITTFFSPVRNIFLSLFKKLCGSYVEIIINRPLSFKANSNNKPPKWPIITMPHKAILIFYYTVSSITAIIAATLLYCQRASHLTAFYVCLQTFQVWTTYHLANL